MLSLNLKDGDYLTINGNIVVQVFRESGQQIRLAIDAPRQVPIVRGAVLEREGEQRPDGLLKSRPKSPSDRIRNAKRLERLGDRKAEEWTVPAE